MSGDTGLIFMLWEPQKRATVTPKVDTSSSFPVNTITEGISSKVSDDETKKTKHPCPHCQT